MAETSVIEASSCPSSTESNDSYTNVYWGIPDSQIYMDERKPTVMQLAQSHSTAIVSTGIQNYRIIPAYTYGGLVQALGEAADKKSFIPNAVVLREDFKLAWAGRQSNLTIAELCNKVISDLTRIRDDVSGYLKDLFYYLKEQTEEVDYLVKETNHDALVIVALSGLRFLSHNKVASEKIAEYLERYHAVLNELKGGFPNLRFSGHCPYENIMISESYVELSLESLDRLDS